MSAEPLSEEELRVIERHLDAPPTSVLARLLATVRAREAVCDRAREEARLWRGLALASWKPEHWGRDKYDTARDALRAAGIDPDAPEGT